MERNWSTRSDAVTPDGNHMNSGDMVYRKVGNVDCLEQPMAAVASVTDTHDCRSSAGRVNRLSRILIVMRKFEQTQRRSTLPIIHAPPYEPECCWTSMIGNRVVEIPPVLHIL